MTDAGASAGVVWWPRLVLWGAVIAAGSLYLLSVEQHRMDAARRAAKPSAVVTAPAADPQGTAAPEPVSATIPQPAAAGTLEVPPTHGSQVVRETQPTRPRLPAAPAGPAVGPLSEPPAPVAHGGAARPVAAASATETQAPPPVASHPAADSEVSPVEARAFAEAVTEGPAAGQAPRAAGPTPAPRSEQKIGVTPARTQSHPDPERARILAEYEALRRAAEGDLQPPGGPVRPGSRDPYGWRPRGYYGPGHYGAPGPGGGYAPTDPRW
jgi:hypothetical protein